MDKYQQLIDLIAKQTKAVFVANRNEFLSQIFDLLYRACRSVEIVGLYKISELGFVRLVLETLHPKLHYL